MRRIIGKLTMSMPDLGESWLILLLLVAGQLAVSFSAVLIAPEVSGMPAAMPVMYVLAYIFPFSYIYWKGAGRLRGKASVPEAPSVFGKPSGRTLAVYAVSAVIMEAALVFLLSIVPPVMDIPDWYVDTLSGLHGSNLVFTLITVAVAAPLLEEFLFRKVILDGLSSRMRPWPAVIWSSVLFAVAHLNPWQALPALILGCFFGWVRLVTGSWWTTAGLHALNNAVTVAVAAVYGPDAALGGSPQIQAQDPVSMILCVLSVLVLAAGSVLFVKYGKSLNNHEKSDISH